MSFRKAAYPALMPQFLAPPEIPDRGDEEGDDGEEQPDDMAAVEAALARRTRGRRS